MENDWKAGMNGKRKSKYRANILQVKYLSTKNIDDGNGEKEDIENSSGDILIIHKFYMFCSTPLKRPTSNYSHILMIKTLT